MITVFTPTYNRSTTLYRLYQSLLKQGKNDFEWLIVDDGSNDNTADVVSSWQNEKKISIRYYKKENEGKHIAINYGAERAKGDIFFIVDSDDYLVENALQIIEAEFDSIRNLDEFAGIVCQRIYQDGKIVGGEGDISKIDTDSIAFRFKYKGVGDHAEIFKTDIIKKYPFPKFEGEKFCSENLVWNRIADKYIMRYLGHKLYICDYQADGLSAKCLINKIKSPQYSMVQSLESAKNRKVPMMQRIKDYSNYWRYFFFSRHKFMDAFKQAGCNSLSFLPLGYLLYLKSKKYKNG